MQDGLKIVPWIVLTAAFVFIITMTIHHPDESQSSQQYRSGIVERIADSRSVYMPGHSLYQTTSSDDSDEKENENDNGGDEDEIGIGDTTGICNRYLETCPEGGTSVTQGSGGSDCNRLFETCPTSPSPSPSPSPGPITSPVPSPSQSLSPSPSPTAQPPIASL